MTAPHLTEIRVRYGECDPQGIVFNPNFLLYFDVAITELWRDSGYPWQKLLDRGLEAVLAETNVRYLAPSGFDDLLELRTTVAGIGSTSINTEIVVVCGGEERVRGTLRHVCINSATRRKAPVPEELRSALAGFAPDRQTG